MELLVRAHSRARWSVVGLVLATTLNAASPPLANDVAPPALRDAVRDVWSRNPAVQSAESRLAAAQAQAEAAGQPLYNPDLDLAAENADVDTRSVGLSQTIDWSGKRQARETAATADVRAAAAERDEVRRRVALDWLRGFAGLQMAAEQAAVGARRVDLLDQFATLADRRFREGDIAVLERDLAALAAHEARAQQALLVAEQAKARQTLIGVGGHSEGLPPLPATLPASSDTSNVASSIDSLPALRRARAETEAAQARIAVAERDRRPDPTIALTAGRVTSPFNDRLIGIAVRIPLFVRNSYSAEVSAARSNADAAQATQQNLALQANAELERAASSYDALRAACLAWEQSRTPSAGERAQLLQRLWEAGEISAADYLVQLKQSADTELAAMSLRARAWQAWADWLDASGRFETWLGIGDEFAKTSGELPR